MKQFNVGDTVVFRKIVKGHWQGVEKQPHVVIETGLKFGEVDILVKNLKTDENIYTNTIALEYAENNQCVIQLSLFDLL